MAKLLDFVEKQQAFSWGEIVEIMHQSHVNEHLILCLCEALLVKDDPDPALWRMQKDVMLKYIQIRCHDLQERQVDPSHHEHTVLYTWMVGSCREGCEGSDGVEGTYVPYGRREGTSTDSVVCAEGTAEAIFPEEEIHCLHHSGGIGAPERRVFCQTSFKNSSDTVRCQFLLNIHTSGMHSANVTSRRRHQEASIIQHKSTNDVEVC